MTTGLIYWLCTVGYKCNILAVLPGAITLVKIATVSDWEFFTMNVCLDIIAVSIKVPTLSLGSGFGLNEVLWSSQDGVLLERDCVGVGGQGEFKHLYTLNEAVLLSSAM
jgi:hypothetical protein